MAVFFGGADAARCGLPVAPNLEFEAIQRRDDCVGYRLRLSVVQVPSRTDLISHRARRGTRPDACRSLFMAMASLVSLFACTASPRSEIESGALYAAAQVVRSSITRDSIILKDAPVRWDGPTREGLGRILSRDSTVAVDFGSFTYPDLASYLPVTVTEIGFGRPRRSNTHGWTVPVTVRRCGSLLKGTIALRRTPDSGWALLASRLVELDLIRFRGHRVD